MKCIIPSPNIKIVARAIHSLSKIGDEVFIEPTENELILRTVNMAQSAFAEFKMTKSFFSSYTFDVIDDVDAICKVTMRSFLGVFKSPHIIDRQVESCEVRIRSNGSVVVFQLKFTNSHIKKYFLPVIDSEKLEAAIPDDPSNRLTASSKFLGATLKNFRTSEDEITIIVNKDVIHFKNHLEFRRNPTFLRTDLCFQPNDFDVFEVNNPVNITFCFKELRAVLTFAEPSNLPVLISFSSPGRPIVFKVVNPPAYEANYVVSTLNSAAVAVPTRHRNSNSYADIDQRLSVGSQQREVVNDVMDLGDFQPQMVDEVTVAPEPRTSTITNTSENKRSTSRDLTNDKLRLATPRDLTNEPRPSTSRDLPTTPLELPTTSADEYMARPSTPRDLANVPQPSTSRDMPTTPLGLPTPSAGELMANNTPMPSTPRDLSNELGPSYREQIEPSTNHDFANFTDLKGSSMNRPTNNLVSPNVYSTYGLNSLGTAYDEQHMTFIRRIFARCYSKTNLLDKIPGNKNVLVVSSDDECI